MRATVSPGSAGLHPVILLREVQELIREDDTYRVELQSEQVKTDTDDIFTLPDALVLYMDHYLDVVRPALLAGRTCDALWITKYGTPPTIPASPAGC